MTYKFVGGSIHGEWKEIGMTLRVGQDYRVPVFNDEHYTLAGSIGVMSEKALYEYYYLFPLIFDTGEKCYFMVHQDIERTGFKVIQELCK